MTIPLSDAAKELGVDPAVLRRWIKRANIQLMTHPTDYRRRVLRQEDFERLRHEREDFLASYSVAAGLEASGTEAAISVETGGAGTGEDMERFVDPRTETEALRSYVTKQYTVLYHQIAAMFAQLAELSERVTRLEENVRKYG
jgi:hypothetical protein